jgi:hypothetical protein
MSGSASDQPARLNIGTYDGVPVGDTLDLAQFEMIRSVNIRIANSDLVRMTVPVAVDIPPTANLMVELAIPADSTVRNRFYIGTNRDGERRP